MAGILKDETGKRFGRLVVIERDYDKSKHDAFWFCRCDCGNVISTMGNRLRDGSCQSCGCLQRELLSKRKSTHRETKTRLYNLWIKIKFRCSNKTSKDYHTYGGRGIIMCDEWRDSFEHFRDWSLANGYNQTLQIDRIDNNGNYCPENCRWTTIKEQARNRRTNRIYEYNGKKYCLVELAEIANITQAALKYRLDNGYDLQKAMFIPLKKDKRRNNG